jgi:hypothetical protein
MLATMLNFGGYRVDRFTPSVIDDGNFGFYIRSQGGEPGSYCREAKSQLYTGLALIYQANLLSRLVGIYLDINVPDNLLRSAYVQLKQDLQIGLFQRVMILETGTLWGSLAAEHDWLEFIRPMPGVDVFTFANGQPVVLPCREKLTSEALG